MRLVSAGTLVLCLWSFSHRSVGKRKAEAQICAGFGGGGVALHVTNVLFAPQAAVPGFPKTDISLRDLCAVVFEAFQPFYYYHLFQNFD